MHQSPNACNGSLATLILLRPPALLLLFAISVPASLPATEAPPGGMVSKADDRVDVMVSELGVDAAFERARKEAFAGNYPEARTIGRRILAQAPDYHDVRVMVGRTYAWEGHWQNARTELGYVLHRRPDHRDALLARIDVERWDDRPRRAEEFADQALEHYPDDPDFLTRKASAQRARGLHQRALETLDRVHAVDAGYQPALELRESMETDRPRPNHVSAGIRYDDYTRIFERDPLVFMQYGRETPWGSAIGRVNYRDRFDTSGTQQEIDLYPGFGAGTYGYLNYGYSRDTTLFPRHRIGAELHTALPRGFEASLGLRHLRFAGGSVTVYTGSLSHYLGNYLFSLRPYVTPAGSGTSVSATATARRYFATADNYLELVAGGGRSVQERQFQDADALGVTLRSWSVSLGAQWEILPHTYLYGSAGYGEEELLFDPDRTTGIWTYSATITHRF